MQQRRVDDVGMADHPAHVRGGPVDLAGIDVVDRLHRPLQRHGVAAVVAHHALGLAGGAGGVEDIEGIGGGQRHAVVGLGRLHGLGPVEVAARGQPARRLGALEDDAVVGLVRGLLDGAVQERQILDDTAALDAAGRRDHGFGFGVVDAYRQLVGGKAAEDHGMDRPQPGTAQHGDQGFGHHGHVDHHPVALGYALAGQDPGKARHLILQLGVGQRPDGVAGDGTVVNDCRLVAAAGFDVAVDGVVAGVELAPREPAIEGRIAGVQHLVPAPGPVDVLGRGGPEGVGIAERLGMGLVVRVAHLGPPGSFCALPGPAPLQATHTISAA